MSGPDLRIRNPHAFMDAAVARLEQDMRDIRNGSRNVTARSVFYRFGTLAHLANGSEQSYMARLEAAALGTGLSKKELSGVVKRAVRDGKRERQPYEIDDSDPTIERVPRLRIARSWTGEAPADDEPRHVPHEDKGPDDRAARAIWAAAVHYEGTPAEAYLRRRKLKPEHIAADIRYSRRGEFHHVIFPSRDADGEVVGIQRVSVDEHGEPWTTPEGRKRKLSIGRIGDGTFHALDGEGAPIVAEGPEDALSIAAAILAAGRAPRPVLATMGSVTRCVGPGVVIFADRGPDLPKVEEAARKAGATVCTAGDHKDAAALYEAVGGAAVLAAIDGAAVPVSALEWWDDIEPSLGCRYLIKGILDDGAMSVVYGPSNSGKTFFTLDLAYHLAIGEPWREHRVTQAAVLYLAAEGGRGILNRIAALKATHGLCDVPLAVRRAGLDLLHQEADLKAVYDLAKEVQARLPDAPLFIVIDTLSRIMAGGDENSAADMTALIRNIDAIREATGAHIMLVHHTGKDSARGARGHSSLRAATDTEIEVQNEDGNRAAMVTKQRDNPGGEVFAFSLKSVTLGMDQDGDDVTSCVIETQDSEEYMVAKKAAKGRGKNQTIIMETFDQMVAEGMATGNPAGVGLPEPGQFWAVNSDQLRRLSTGKMVGADPSKLFRQAWAALTGSDGVFCSADNLSWRVDRRKR